MTNFLKRKASSTLDESRRAGPFPVEYKFKPKNLEALSNDVVYYKNFDLQMAMCLEKDQFKNFTSFIRTLARELLDRDVLWQEQADDVRQRFIVAACNREPDLREWYEDAWPIRVYASRYLKGRLMNNMKAQHHGEKEGASSVQMLIEQPSNIKFDDFARTRKRLDCLRTAMKSEQGDFERFKSNLQNSARCYLDMFVDYADQDESRKRKFIDKAREDPYLANYKNAWPAEIYTAFYLHRRIHDTRFKERQQRQQKQSTGSSRQLQNHDDSFEGDDSDSDVEILDGPTNVSHHASRPVSRTIPSNTQDNASRAPTPASVVGSQPELSIPSFGRQQHHPAVLSVSNVARRLNRGNLQITGPPKDHQDPSRTDRGLPPSTQTSAPGLQLCDRTFIPPARCTEFSASNLATKENIPPNLSLESSSSASTVSSSSTESASISSEVFTMSPEVKQFLLSLSPSMDSPDQMKRFWKVGIRDKDTLASFESCNFAEREMLFKELQALGLSHLELIGLRRHFR